MPLESRSKEKKTLVSTKPLTSAASKFNRGRRQIGLVENSKNSLKDSVAILKQQLRHLESSLNFYRRENDELKECLSRAEFGREKSETDLVDVIEHLRRELSKCRDELESKQSELLDTDSTKSALIEHMKNEIEAREKTLVDEIVSLKEENSVLSTKLDSLGAFMREKHELERRLIELKSKMDELRATHARDLKSIEKRILLDKHAMRNEMLEKLNEMAHAIRMAACKQMSESEQRGARTVNEVRAINRELSRANVELVEENRVLNQRLVELRAEKSSFKDMERTLSRKCVLLEKDLKITAKRIVALENSQSCMSLAQSEIEKLRNENSSLKINLSNLESELINRRKSVNDRSCDCESKAVNLNKQRNKILNLLTYIFDRIVKYIELELNEGQQKETILVYIRELAETKLRLETTF